MKALATILTAAIASTGCYVPDSRCRIEASYSSLLWSCCLKITMEHLRHEEEQASCECLGRSE